MARSPVGRGALLREDAVHSGLDEQSPCARIIAGARRGRAAPREARAHLDVGAAAEEDAECPANTKRVGSAPGEGAEGMEFETTDHADVRLRVLRSSDVTGAGVEGALDALVQLATGPRLSGERCAPLGEEVVAKGGRTSEPGARRHSARRWLTGARPPVEAEALNLDWLRERLFRAASPVLALTVWRRGLLRGQLLLTRPVVGAAELDLAWESEREKPTLAAELGAELGRMHALRFLHGDAYARNLLVTDAPAAGGPGIGRRVAFIDAWAGGPAGWRSRAFRPLERDLGSLFLDAAEWMEPDHQRILLRSYLSARRQNGRPIRDVESWLTAIGRARARELRRLEQRPGRLRGHPPPPVSWRIDPASLRADRRRSP